MIDLKIIQENAIAICNFLELRTIDKRARKNPIYHIPFSNIPGLEYSPGCCDPSIEMDTDVFATATKFHSDWTWLMEVVDKIEAHHQYQDVEIKGNRCMMTSFSAFDDCFDKWFEGDTKIDATYKACVEFIKWYNNSKQ